MTHSSDTNNSSLWIESGELREGPVAQVAMVASIEGQYRFAVPDELADKVAPGKRLLVPFGRHRRLSPAFCVSVGREKWTSTLKPVTEVLDQDRLLGDNLLELGQWISRYYYCPLGRTFRGQESSLSLVVRCPICRLADERAKSGEPRTADEGQLTSDKSGVNHGPDTA